MLLGGAFFVVFTETDFPGSVLNKVVKWILVIGKAASVGNEWINKK